MDQAPGTPSTTSGRLELLKLRDYRNVFIAQSVSVFGDGITPVALTFAVLDLTGSGTDLGLVLAAQSLPLASLALVGGVWADRLPRAALMVSSDLIRAAVQAMAALLLLTGTAHIWQLAVLAALHGSAEAFFRPAAGAIIPQIVPTPRLQQANALMGMSDNFGWMVGPAVAGTLVAVIGPGGAIAVDSATFLVSAAFLATLRSVVGTRGQRVAAGDRLYLAEALPLLIVWGSNDPIIPVGHGEHAHETLPGSRLEVFEGVGHLPQLEEPGRFIAVLERFLTETEPAQFDRDEWRARFKTGRPGA